MSITEKIVAYVENQAIPEPTDCYAVPGEDSIIDVIHPATGLTVYCKETAEQIQARYPLAVRMTIQEFCDQKALRQDELVTWSTVTEETYYEMLECLPPAYMGNHGFLVGEPWDHHATTGRPRYAAYRHAPTGYYWTASRPMTIQEFKAVGQVPA